MEMTVRPKGAITEAQNVEQGVIPAQLDPQDVNLLSEIAITGSVAKAAQNLGLSSRQARNRLKRPEVSAEYEKMFGMEEVQNAHREIQLLAGSTIADIIEEIRDAEETKNFNVTCPHCNRTFATAVKVIAYSTKLRAAEFMARVTKLINNDAKVTVDGKTEHHSTNLNITMTTPQALALQRLRDGVGVPDYMYNELRQLAAQAHFELPPNPGSGVVVEGEYSALDSDE